MIEAYIKSEPCKYQNKDFEFIVGSITDCFYKLEIKFAADFVIPNLKKGNTVRIQGVMERYAPGPPVLKVHSIIPLPGRNRISFVDIIGGFRNKE